MANVAFHPDAQREYQSAIGWYQLRSATAAQRFVAEVERVIAAIATQPDRYGWYEEPFRQAGLRRYPYSVIYRVEASGDVLVVAVAHASKFAETPLRRRRRAWADLAGSDPPIPPHLNMVFRLYYFIGIFLFCFFLLTWRPASNEGYIPLRLAPNADAIVPLNVRIWPPEPTTYILRVNATNQGAIASMYLLEEGIADAVGTKLGADVELLLRELRALAAAEQTRRRIAILRGQPAVLPPALVIEIDGRMIQAYIVQLLDAAIQSGFEDIVLVPLARP